MQPESLVLPDRTLAYHKIKGREPGVIFLGGFFSDMTGTKATFLAEHCAAAGQAFLRFDYRGHGQSGGRFADGTIGAWLNDALQVFDRLTAGPQILVGSSMGGWLALLLARLRPERVHAIVGIAAAPDFTEALMWQQLSPVEQERLRIEGVLLRPSDDGGEPMPITWRLIEEGRNHLLLQGPIELSCPLHLLQGAEDEDVPCDWPEKIAARVTTQDVEITLIPGGNHRLSREADLALLWREVSSLF